MEESTDVLDKQWFRYLVVAALLSGGDGNTGAGGWGYGAGGGASNLSANTGAGANGAVMVEWWELSA